MFHIRGSAVLFSAANDNYYCYHWSDEDIAEMGYRKGLPSAEAPVCESYVGNVFTQGYNEKYPNCGGCWCCQAEGKYFHSTHITSCFHQV